MKNSNWPELHYENWKDTIATLHMWMQIVGKVKLSFAPFINQWWEVAFHLTATGMTTGKIPYNNKVFQINFDFINHNLIILTSDNQTKTITLEPMSVAVFYKNFMNELNSLDIYPTIRPVPTEVTDIIPFQKDTQHASYDKDYVTKWWRIMLQSNVIFDLFRSSFSGKSSPIQFFWGSLDLNGTRFSGKTAKPPKLTGEMGRIMRYAENEENFAFGFWPGDKRYPHPAYYIYMYPQPKGFETISFGRNASFHEKLAECLYPYDELRKTNSPEKTLLTFLNKSYLRSAKLADWDIKSFKTVKPTLNKIS